MANSMLTSLLFYFIIIIFFMMWNLTKAPPLGSKPWIHDLLVRTM